MPEVYFQVAWPDGRQERCYSPSTVIHKYLEAGQAYALADFLARSREALALASERVAAKYGFRCSGAEDQLARLEEAASRFDHLPDPRVTVLALDGPTPPERGGAR